MRPMASAHFALRLRPEALRFSRNRSPHLNKASSTRDENDLLGPAAHRIQEFVMGLQVVHL